MIQSLLTGCGNTVSILKTGKKFRVFPEFEASLIVLGTALLLVKRRHDQGNSYKRAHLIGTCITFQRLRLEK